MLEKLQFFIHGGMSALYIFMAIELIVPLRHTEEHPSRARKWCSALFFLISAQTLFWVVLNLLNIYEGTLKAIEVAFDALAIPMFVIVFNEVLRAKTFGLLTATMHLFAPVIMIVAYLIYPDDTILNFGYFYYSVYVVYEFHQCLKAYKRYNKELLNTYAEIEDRKINWTKHIGFSMIALFSIYLLLDILFYNVYGGLFYCVASVPIWSYIWMNVSLMRNNSLISAMDTEGNISDAIEELVNTPAERRKDNVLLVMSEEDKTAFLRKLDIIREKKLFCEPDFNREEALKIIGGNRTTFSANLKAATGKTFTSYIREMRVNYAIELLKDENVTVDYVASMTGFNTPQTFYRIFKQETGMTPTEKREEIRNGRSNA